MHISRFLRSRPIEHSHELFACSRMHADRASTTRWQHYICELTQARIARNLKHP